MRKRSSLSILIRMMTLVRPLSAHMLIAVLFGTLGHLCAISIPILGVLALLSATSLVSINLNSIFIMMILCGLFRGIFAYIEQNRNHYIAFRLLALIRDQVFTSLRKLCPAKLDGKNRGELIAIITADIELLEVFYAHTVSPILIAICVGSIMVLSLSQLHIAFAITASIAYLATGIILPIMMSKKAQTLYAMQRNNSGKLSGYYMDSLRGIHEINQMNCGQQRLDEIKQQTTKLTNMMGSITKEDGKVAAIADTLVIGFSFLMLTLGFCLTANFSLTILSTVAMLSSFGPVLSLSRLSTGLSRVLAAGERVIDLLDENPEVVENNNGEIPHFTGVNIENLTFSYGEEEILKDLSLEFEKGKIFGIYGKSGSGKSTLLKLLLRFWNSPKDSVKISNHDISVINTSHLRKMESYMIQETDLFHSSIAENIRIGNLSASIQEIQDAAKKASVHDFIMSLSNGYDTQVGELGDTLSSGEKQRIGLARAFLHDAPLMLLDEPTSNLDSLNEAVILKSLKTENESRTVILVSHRKSTLSICDSKVTVDYGRLA